MTELKLFYSFYTNKEKTLAFFSTCRQDLLEHLNNNISPIIIQSLDIDLNDNAMLKTIQNNFNENKVYIAENIRNIKELATWILVSGDNFHCEEDWFGFLKNNGLVKDWINGNLVYTIAHYYHESSKDFGPRHKYKETRARFSNIWDFKAYFNGFKTTQKGDYYQYWYEDITKIIKIENQDKIFKLNSDWVDSLKNGCEPTEIDLKFVKAGNFEI